MSGREIKKAVISACVHTVKNNRDVVTQNDFYHACDVLIEEKEQLSNAKDHTVSRNKPSLSKEQETVLKDIIKSKIAEEGKTETEPLEV